MGTTHSSNNNIVESYKIHRAAAPIKENFTSTACPIVSRTCCGPDNNYTCRNGLACPRNCGYVNCMCPPTVVPCTTADCNSRGVPSGDRPNCTCQCDPPFKGAQCAEARTECTAANACNNHGTPTQSFQNDAGSCGACNCNAGYSGADCSTSSACTATAVANSDKSAAGAISGNAGDTVTVTCHNGYTGGGTWTCGADGNFSGTACSANACTGTAVANSDKSGAGSITGDTGETVAVTCNQGYTGGGTWTCGVNGQFTGTGCSASSCTATAVANSDKSGAGSITGDTGNTVAVTCNDGYTGGGTWTCGVNGQFTGTACNANSCTGTAVANSDKSGAGSITGNTGDTVAVTCNDGYSGGGDWTCGVNGQFSGSNCSIGSCTGTAVANSDKSGAGSITGDTGETVTVTCDGGYTGGGTWTCGVNGQFSGTGCSANSCTATAVANSDKSAAGSITGNTGNTVAVTCNDGYTGGGDWTCGSNGSFTGSNCSIIGCTATEVANSDKSDSDSITGNAGATVEVQCDAGYTGGGTWTCGNNGSFTGSNCDASACTATETANSDKSAVGSITGDTGETVAVTCNDGYTGGGDWTCGSNGSFTGTGCTLPGCTATQVDHSDKSADGSITGVTDATVEVQCDAGYTGGGTWTCGSNGSFTGTGCSASACTATEAANSDQSGAGSITGNTGDTVAVDCDDGYDGGGDWTCGADGSFTGDPCYTCGPNQTALRDCKFKVMTTGNEEATCNGDSNCFFDKNTSCRTDFTTRIACNSRTQSECGTNDACQWDANYQICKPNDAAVQACASKDSAACTSAPNCQWMGTCHTKPSSAGLSGWTGTKGLNCADNMNSILSDTAAANPSAKTTMEGNRIIYCNTKGLPKPGDDVECNCNHDYSGTNCEIPPAAVSTCPTHLTRGNADSCYDTDGTPRKHVEGCCWAPDGSQVKGADGSLASFTWFKQDMNRVDGQNNCGCDCTKAVTAIVTEGNRKHETVVDFTDESVQYHYNDTNLTYTDANGNSVAYGKSCVKNCTDSSPTDCLAANGAKLTGGALELCANVNTPCHDRGQCNARTNKCEDTLGNTSYCDMDVANGAPYLGDYCQDDGNPNANDLSRYNAFCGTTDAQGNSSGYAVPNTSGDGKPFKCSCNGDWGHSGKDAWDHQWGSATEDGDERGIYACDVSPCEGNTWKTLQTNLDNLMPLEVDTYEYLNSERPVYITRGMTVHWPDAYKATSQPDGFSNRLKMNPNVALTSDNNFDFTKNHIVVAAVAPRHSAGVAANWETSTQHVQDNSYRTPGSVMKKTIFEMEGEHDANASNFDKVYLGIQNEAGVITPINYHQLPAGAKMRFSWPYTGVHDSLTCGHFDYSSGSVIDTACRTDNNGNNRVCPCVHGLVKDGQDMCQTSKCKFGWYGAKCQYPMDGRDGRPNLCDWNSLEAIANPQATSAADQYKWVDLLNGFPMDRTSLVARLALRVNAKMEQRFCHIKLYLNVSRQLGRPRASTAALRPTLTRYGRLIPALMKLSKADLLPNESSNQTCMVVRRDGQTIVDGDGSSPLDISYVGKGDTLANKWQKGGVDQDPSSNMVNLITYGGGDPADRVVESTPIPHQVYCYTEDGPNAQHPHALALSRYSGTPEACRIMATKRSPCGTMAPSGDPLGSHSKDPAQYIWKEGATGRTRADLCGIPAEAGTCATGPQQYGRSSATGVSCNACTASLTQSITGSEMGGTGDDGDKWSEYAGPLDMQRKCTQMGDGPITYWKGCDCTWGGDACDVGDSTDTGGCFTGWSRNVCRNTGADADCEGDNTFTKSGNSMTAKPG